MCVVSVFKSDRDQREVISLLESDLSGFFRALNRLSSQFSLDFSNSGQTSPSLFDHFLLFIRLALSRLDQTSEFLLLFLFRPPERHRQHHPKRQTATQLHLLQTSNKVILESKGNVESIVDPLHRRPFLVNLLPGVTRARQAA